MENREGSFEWVFALGGIAAMVSCIGAFLIGGYYYSETFGHPRNLDLFFYFGWVLLSVAPFVACAGIQIVLSRNLYRGRATSLTALLLGAVLGAILSAAGVYLMAQSTELLFHLLFAPFVLSGAFLLAGTVLGLRGRSQLKGES